MSQTAIPPELLQELRNRSKPKRVESVSRVLEPLLREEAHSPIAVSVLDAVTTWLRNQDAEHEARCRSAVGDAEEVFNEYACTSERSPFWTAVCYGGWSVTEDYPTNAVHCVVAAAEVLGADKVAARIL